MTVGSSFREETCQEADSPGLSSAGEVPGDADASRSAVVIHEETGVFPGEVTDTGHGLVRLQVVGRSVRGVRVLRMSGPPNRVCLTEWHLSMRLSQQGLPAKTMGKKGWGRHAAA